MTGYNHKFQHNLIIVLMATGALILAFILANAIDCLSCFGRRKNKRQRSKCTAWTCNFSVRFVYEFFLEVLLCVLVHLSTQRSEDRLIAYVLHVLTIIICILLAGATVFVITLCFHGGPSIKASDATKPDPISEV